MVMVNHLGPRAEVAQISKLFPRFMSCVPYYRAVGYSPKIIVTISLEDSTLLYQIYNMRNISLFSTGLIVLSPPITYVP